MGFRTKCGYVSKTPEGVLLKLNSDFAAPYSSSLAMLDSGMPGLRTASTVRLSRENCGDRLKPESCLLDSKARQAERSPCFIWAHTT